MENGINKIGFFDAKVEPYLRPISDLGIGFYNLDENTATLRFQLSNDAGALLISDNNLMVYGYFESSNDSVSDVIEMNIVEELKGVVEITLDKDFLHASTSTKVNGQLYIGVKNVDGKPEYNEVAVLGEFNFEVKDALINKISSFTKIEYIRMFSQLKAKIEKEVLDIQEAIKNGADYVAEMKSVKEQGIAEMNKTVIEGKTYIDGVIAQAQTNINNTATSAISDVNSAKDNAVNTMNTKVNESVGNVDNTSKGAIKHVEDKLAEFNTAIEEKEFLTPDDLLVEMNATNWQKYRLTADNGRAFYMTGKDWNDPAFLDSLMPGEYYITMSLNPPAGVSYNAFVTMRHRDNAASKMIEYRPYNSPRRFIKFFNVTWSNWLETGVPADTGWIPFNLINGAMTNSAFTATNDNGFGCAYRTITNGSVTEKIVRINATRISHQQVIAQLPTNFAKNVQFGYVRAPINSGYGLVGVYPSGSVYVYIESDKRSSWDSTSDAFYFYGEISWYE